MQLSIVPSSFKPIKSDVHRCLLHNYKDSYYMAVYIKTHNSESGGQEEAELFTGSTAQKFIDAVTKPP